MKMGCLWHHPIVESFTFSVRVSSSVSHHSFILLPCPSLARPVQIHAAFCIVPHQTSPARRANTRALSCLSFILLHVAHLFFSFPYVYCTGIRYSLSPHARHRYVSGAFASLPARAPSRVRRSVGQQVNHRGTNHAHTLRPTRPWPHVRRF